MPSYRVGDTTVLMAGQKGSIFKNGDDDFFTWHRSLFNYDASTPALIPWTDFYTVARAIPFRSLPILVTASRPVPVSKTSTVNLVCLASAVLPIRPPVRWSAISPMRVTTSPATSASLVVVFSTVLLRTGACMPASPVRSTCSSSPRLSRLTQQLLDVLASASATFDMFTLAATVEGVNTAAGVSQFGGAASASAAVTDTVTINLGFRYFDQNTAVWRDRRPDVAGGLVFAVTETIDLDGRVGYYTSTIAATPDVTYGSVELAWVPGGGFTSSIKGELNSAGAYKTTFKAKKTFQQLSNAYDGLRERPGYFRRASFPFGSGAERTSPKIYWNSGRRSDNIAPRRVVACYADRDCRQGGS